MAASQRLMERFEGDPGDIGGRPVRHPFRPCDIKERRHAGPAYAKLDGLQVSVPMYMIIRGGVCHIHQRLPDQKADWGMQDTAATYQDNGRLIRIHGSGVMMGR